MKKFTVTENAKISEDFELEKGDVILLENGKKNLKEDSSGYDIKVNPRRFDRETLIDIINDKVSGFGEGFRSQLENIEYDFDNDELENPIVKLDYSEVVEFHLTYDTKTGKGEIWVDDLW